MTNMNSKRAWRQWAILAVLVGMLLLPLILVGLWVHAKHQWGRSSWPRWSRAMPGFLACSNRKKRSSRL